MTRAGGFRLAGVLQQHAHGVDRGDRIDDVLAGVLRGAAAHRLVHAGAARIGIDVAAGGHAHAALQDAAQVGDDVAEHVRRHDHVVVLGILDHPHAAGVDVVVVGLDVGIFAGHFLKRSPPQVVAVGQHVGLGDEREHLLGVVAAARELEGPADAALAALAGVDGRLAGDFVGRVLLQEAADAAIQVFGVLADDDEVDVCRALVAERRLDAGKQLHRPQVDVLIELKSQLEQQAFFEDARRHVGMADRAQIDGVELAQLVDGARPAAFRRCADSARRRNRSAATRSESFPARRRPSSTFRPSAATSGPVPSPPMTAILSGLAVLFIRSILAEVEMLRRFAA